MSANAKLPLTEPQHRHLTVCLAALEKQLRELRERLQSLPRNARLIHYEDQFGKGERDALLPIINEAENRLRRIADELALDGVANSVRRTVIAGLDVASINLDECRATAGLAGYGVVAPETADYLDREIPKLDEVIESLLRAVRHPASQGRAE